MKELILPIIMIILMTWICVWACNDTEKTYKLRDIQERHNLKQNMNNLFPLTYKDTSGVASVTLADKTIYCYDSAMDKQYVKTYKPEILQNILADLQYKQANVSLKRSPDYYTVEWDNVHYIPHVGELIGEPKTEKK